MQWSARTEAGPESNLKVPILVTHGNRSTRNNSFFFWASYDELGLPSKVLGQGVSFSLPELQTKLFQALDFISLNPPRAPWIPETRCILVYSN